MKKIIIILLVLIISLVSFNNEKDIVNLSEENSHVDFVVLYEKGEFFNELGIDEEIKLVDNNNVIYYFNANKYDILSNNLTSFSNDFAISSQIFNMRNIPDSLYFINRPMYALNTALDNKIVYPLSRAYVSVVPRPVRTGISNFFNNFKEVPTFFNSILQLKSEKAINALSRFTINSTIGLLGIFDPSTKMGIYRETETFSDTLGYYGVPTGDYLVLPFYGPSSIRDAVGIGVDSLITYQALNNVENHIFIESGIFDDTVYQILKPTVSGVNLRSLINFRYGDLNSPFEYDIIKIFYYNMKKFQIRE